MVDYEGLAPGCARSFFIQIDIVADMENFGRIDLEASGRLQKDPRRRFRGTDLA
jgi:hypothetical protein